jgi:hypothetical protein
VLADSVREVENRFNVRRINSRPCCLGNKLPALVASTTQDAALSFGSLWFENFNVPASANSPLLGALVPISHLRFGFQLHVNKAP